MFITFLHNTPVFFQKDKEAKAFDFGKSKFSSRHEVVRRGKDVEVKLDNLKIGKDDTLRVVVVRKFIFPINNISRIFPN